MVQAATAKTRSARPRSSAASRLTRPALSPHRPPDELRGGRARQLHERPDREELERREGALGARQEAEHDEAETEIVGLGQGVQARKRVRKAHEADRAGDEEEDPGADREHAEEVDSENSSAVPASSASVSAEAALLTKAAEAKAASSASPRATSSTPAPPVAAR